MPKILQLSPHVADLIAAGEVVERPGSVVKELMENSIDAGAASLTVEIRNGGMTYIRVTDNGCGITPEDAGTAFLRHATSKLHDERGLEAIGTLGFRGEALASISAVSRVEMLTREKGAAEGTKVLVDGGDITSVLPAGAPEGTTMIVRDLFFNTPARLKFMKNDKAEGANVTSAVLHCALSHPEVSVKYVRDGKEEFHTPGDGRTDSCIYCLLGREFSGAMLKTESESGGVAVSGFISTPAGARGNRSNQFFFVNGRTVKSKLLQAALEQAYKNQLFSGRFPACVLYLKLSTGAVDVNVHPAKTEVRFLHEKEVFDAVYYAALGALGREEKKPELTLNAKQPSAEPAPAVKTGAAKPAAGFYRAMSADEYRSRGAEPGARPFQTRIAPVRESGGPLSLHDIAGTPKAEHSTPSAGAEKKREETTPSPAEHTAASREEEPYRIIGEGLDTYILVERGESLFLIDKHAAHERMIFDRLKGQERNVMAQMLLSPYACRLPGGDAEILTENRELLCRLGFDIELFGEDGVIVRQVPADMDSGEIRGMLEELAEKLRGAEKVDAASAEDAILHTVACKAAIKAGKRSEPGELAAIARGVMSGQVKYCPHGRPVAMELTKNALDKNFKRI